MAIDLTKGTSGLAGAAPAAGYTATNPAVVYVSLVNSDSVARTANAYVNRGTRRRFTTKDLNLAAGAAWPPNGPYGPIVLASGQSIDFDASQAGVVEYIVSPVEKS